MVPEKLSTARATKCEVNVMGLKQDNPQGHSGEVNNFFTADEGGTMIQQPGLVGYLVSEEN